MVGRPFEKGAPGRPKGSRNKLTEQFWKDFVGAWEEHGAKALQTVATTDPTAFVKVAASLMPKDVNITRAEDLTEEQLDARIRQLAAALGIEAPALGEHGGTASSSVTH